MEAARQLRRTLGAALALLPHTEEGSWDPRSIGERIDRLKALRRDQDRLKGEVLSALRGIPWYLEVFDFLPAVRRRRDRRLLWPLIERELPLPELGSSGFEGPLLEHLRSLDAPRRAEVDLLCWIQEELAAVPADSALWDAVRAAPSPILAVPQLLDVGLRHRLFLLAGRYWEGRWLHEMEELLSDVESPPLPPAEARLARFRRIAKLTPVLVSTLFRSPRVFDYYDPEEGRGHPLLECLDLLIVDEGGQVPPDLGAAVLGLAQRAVVIGDEHQIEPIWGIHRRVDSANFKAVGLDSLDPDLDPLRAASSSLLRAAQRSTRFTSAPRRDGTLLREHRRCVPEVIAYCNALVYGGQLEPHREALPSSPLPALGWGHVRSEAKRLRGSWTNPGEAWAIARWLTARRDQIEAFYGRPMEEVVGVVTPFSAQRTELLKALTPAKKPGRKKKRRQGEDDDPLPLAEIGTVHTFQGAEREIMIFSPVYSAPTAPRKRFFDDGKNMLNVAVSRAKDSFLVFGDMELFDPMSPAPSGVLATHLFRAPENEIPDLSPLPGAVAPGGRGEASGASAPQPGGAPRDPGRRLPGQPRAATGGLPPT